MFVPTVVFYLPEKEKSAHLIGKFDKETIQKHESKFVKGQLPTFPMKTKSSQIEIRDIDCPNLEPLVETPEVEDKGLEDEILQEILREDEERRKRIAEEEAEFKKNKKSKKSKKKAKKDEM